MLRSPRALALIVGLSLFMQSLDGTILVTAFPAMATVFHEPVLKLHVTITSYLIGAAMFIPLSGWLADRFGARSIFCVAVGLFAVASAFCGLSQTFLQLIVARVVQGAAGAMLLPVGRLILLNNTPKDQLLEVTTWLALPAIFGPLFGPPLGAFFSTYASWRWVFFVNLPIAALGLIFAVAVMPATKEDNPGPLDYWGVFLCGGALAGLSIAFENLATVFIAPSLAIFIGACGAVCFATYLVHARRVRVPILDLSLMRIPTFAVCTVASFTVRLCISAAPYLLVLLLQVAYSVPAMQSGGLILCLAVGSILMRVFASGFVRKVGYRQALILGALVTGGSFTALGYINPHTAIIAMAALMIVHGFARSVELAVLGALAFADVPARSMSAASTLNSVVGLLCQSVGIALATMTLKASQAARGAVHVGLFDVQAAFLVLGALGAATAAMFYALPGGVSLSSVRPAKPAV